MLPSEFFQVVVCTACMSWRGDNAVNTVENSSVCCVTWLC